ncbi:MAG: tetratricopeptide repeat protein [Pyrinomonadaceae bacterium]
MNLFVESNRTRAYRQAMLCLALGTIFSLALEVHAQNTVRTKDLLQPARPNLVPLHWPDLTKLEADVREQLTSLQSSLAATVKNPKTSEVELSNAYGTMGEIYQAYSLNSPTRECYLNASRLAPHEFRWVYLLGKLDQQEGLVDDAIRRYKIAGALRPEYVAVPVNLGNIHLQLNRLEEAEESFKAALVMDENTAAALYGLGQVALSQRNYAEAVKYFEKALALIPAANRIHYSLAMAYRGLGDKEKATVHLAQQGTVGVQVSDPLVQGLQELVRGERIHLSRGKLALEARRYAEAADEYRKAIAANRDSLPAHVNLGATLVSTGDPKGAAEQYEEALRIDPANTNANYNLAILLANENKHGPAIAHLQSVLGVNPNDLDARFFLARELLKSERPEEALAEFSRVVAADASNEDALLEQVQLLQQRKQYKTALESLEKGHAQYPRRGRTAVMLAYLLAASPQYDLRDGARALELARNIYRSTSLLEHGALIAMALAELGRCREAAEWQRRIIAAAEQERKTKLAAKLTTDLKVYEQTQPCRPRETAGGTNPN